jgi:predicted ferric reductase
LLRTGQMLGIVAGLLLLLQIILSARLKCLDRIFGMSSLLRFHRITGAIIAVLVCLHPILIFIPEGRISIPLQLRCWPEFVGLFLALLVIFTVIASYWRARLRLAFHRWRPMSECSISSAVFICGPNRMMKAVLNALLGLGFSRRIIYLERFAL